MSLLGIFDISGSAMNAESMRLNVTASNLANADSVAASPQAAYRSRHPVFATQLREFAADPAASEPGAGVGTKCVSTSVCTRLRAAVCAACTTVEW